MWADHSSGIKKKLWEGIPTENVWKLETAHCTHKLSMVCCGWSAPGRGQKARKMGSKWWPRSSWAMTIGVKALSSFADRIVVLSMAWHSLEQQEWRWKSLRLRARSKAGKGGNDSIHMTRWTLSYVPEEGAQVPSGAVNYGWWWGQMVKPLWAVEMYPFPFMEWSPMELKWSWIMNTIFRVFSLTPFPTERMR